LQIFSGLWFIEESKGLTLQANDFFCQR
jgi:hypothetical protein